MRRIVWFALLGVLACGPDAPAEGPAPPLPAVTLPAELDRVLRDYEAAYAGRDTAALGELFVEDGYLLQPGRAAVRGRAAVARVLSREGGPLALVPVAYGMADSVGYIVGTFGAAGSAAEGGKFVLALRREGAGPWRIAADIANPNR
jgi:ketosteroid isomerase-like protein